MKLRWPIQTAVYARLTGDPVLMAMITGVFDHIPGTAAQPYVVIGESTEEPSHAHDRKGTDASLTLHVWSRYAGYKQAAAIVKELDRLLDRWHPTTVDEHQAVTVFNDNTQYLTDTDPALRHAVVRYAVWAEEQEEVA